MREGAFRKMDAGWAIVKPCDPAKSELVRRISTDDFEDDDAAAGLAPLADARTRRRC